jgi:hypothetical protein
MLSSMIQAVRSASRSKRSRHDRFGMGGSGGKETCLIPTPNDPLTARHIILPSKQEQEHMGVRNGYCENQLKLGRICRGS